MAQIQVNFVSRALLRTVSVNVILPTDKILMNPDKKLKPFKTLYLLNGIFGNYTDWVTNTRIQQWAEDHDLAVVMPSGDNSFYIDMDLPNNNYGVFIGEELVKVTREMFHLSTRREDTFIGGLSMGGFGALRNGLKYHDTFGYIVSLSAALNIFEKDADDPTRCLINEDAPFGDLEKARNSDKNPRYLTEHFEGVKPKIFMAVGLQDQGCLEPNRKFKPCLEENGFDVTYKEADGIHNWVFWDTYIKEALDWLPLEDKDEAINSGNVKVVKS